MVNFALILVCIFSGMIIAKLKILPENAYKGINVWVIYVALPALVLRYIPDIEWSTSHIVPALTALLVWFGAWLFITLLSKKVTMSRETKAVLIVCSGLGNTSFLGFPMVAAFYREEWIKDALVFDQATFLIFSTLAIFLIMKTAFTENGRINAKEILLKIFGFPSFIAAVIAIVFSIWLDFSPFFPFLDKLVATLSPLAIFSIGLQFKIGDWRKELPYLSIGISYKLLIAPILVMLLLLATGVSGSLAKATLFESAMSSHISGSLLATQYDLNPKLCSLLVNFTIASSFLTVVIWYFVGEAFF